MKIVKLWEELVKISKEDEERIRGSGFPHSDIYYFKRGEIRAYVEELLVTIQTSPDPMNPSYCMAMTELAYYNSKVSILCMLRFK